MVEDSEPAPIHALLLAGGKSRRMGQDKATLLYQGRTQLARTLDLLRQLDIPSSLSIRQGQDLPDEAKSADATAIQDQPGLEDIGPFGGILSAFAKLPRHALLVLACDLPFLDNETLETLLAQREPTRLATAYRSHHDGLPEPLCAIWEPHGLPHLREQLEARLRCPRKILIQGDTHLLTLPIPHALDNINTPEDYAEALARLDSQTA